MTTDPKLEKLNKILNILDDQVSAKDLQQFLSTLLDFLRQTVRQLRAEYATFNADANARIEAKLATLKNGKDGKDGRDGAPGRDGIDGVKGDKGDPGQNADMDSMVADILAKFATVPGLTEAVRNGLETLQGEERLKASAIDGLDERVSAIVAAQPRTSSGGGVTNMRIQQAFKYILKTEQPTGTIDGVNTIFTVTQPIFAVLSMSLNGETIAQLPNYTIAGKAIIFTSPLPADYSGKDFEIKYI